MAKTVKIKVPQPDGDIVVNYGGDPPKKYPVKDSTVNVDEGDVSAFLVALNGSSLAGGTKAAGGPPQ